MKAKIKEAINYVCGDELSAYNKELLLEKIMGIVPEIKPIKMEKECVCDACPIKDKCPKMEQIKMFFDQKQSQSPEVDMNLKDLAKKLIKEMFPICKCGKPLYVAREYVKRGHTVKIRLQDFHEDSEEHKALEWEVSVDFDNYLCHGCNHMKDATIHGVVKYDNNNYCDECAKNLVVNI